MKMFVWNFAAPVAQDLSNGSEQTFHCCRTC